MTQQNKQISIHAPKAQRPQTEEQFSYFLTGLIDANGHINNSGFISINLHPKDVSVAYFIKKRIGYGKVKIKENKDKKHNDCIYICTHKEGIKKIGKLIYKKLKTPSIIEQYYKLEQHKYNDGHSLEDGIKVSLTYEINSVVNQRADPLRQLYENYKDDSLNNTHWLAGFIQGSFASASEHGGCFKINILINSIKTEVQMIIQINHEKTNIVLKQIQKSFEGSISYCKSKETYYYSSTSFAGAKKFINYLDRYQVMGGCITAYWMW